MIIRIENVFFSIKLTRIVEESFPRKIPACDSAFTPAAFDISVSHAGSSPLYTEGKIFNPWVRAKINGTKVLQSAQYLATLSDHVSNLREVLPYFSIVWVSVVSWEKLVDLPARKKKQSTACPLPFQLRIYKVDIGTKLSMPFGKQQFEFIKPDKQP